MAKTKPQPTIVHVKVVTAGPVPMKAVREWVGSCMALANEAPPTIAGQIVTSVTVKRDANIERPS